MGLLLLATNSSLDTLSSQAHTAMDGIKAAVPYEVWFCLAIALGVMFLFAKGGNSAYGGFWRVGVYVAIIAIGVWFVLTR